MRGYAPLDIQRHIDESRAAKRAAPKSGSLLALALAQIEATQQWPLGHKLVLATTPISEAYVYNDDCRLNLYVRPTVRWGKCSAAFRVGWLDLAEGVWKVAADATREKYEEWSAKIKTWLPQAIEEAKARIAKEKKRMGKYDSRLPELVRKAEKRFPELTSRPMSAAEIVRKGSIKRISTTTFRVQSNALSAEYTVDIHRRSCTCYDAQHNKPRWCKHHLAVLMRIRLEQPATTDAGEIHRQEKRIAALQAGAILI